MLSPQTKWLYRAGFVLCMCTVAVAAVGVFAIADAQERKYRISNTRFADWVYALVQFNQVGTRSRCSDVVKWCVHHVAAPLHICGDFAAGCAGDFVEWFPHR